MKPDMLFMLFVVLGSAAAGAASANAPWRLVLPTLAVATVFAVLYFIAEYRDQ